MFFSPFHLAICLALIMLISLQPSFLFDAEGTTIRLLTREYCNRNNPFISKLVHKLIRCRESVSVSNDFTGVCDFCLIQHVFFCPEKTRESLDRFKECWRDATQSDYPRNFTEWKEFLCSESFDTQQRQIRDCYNKNQTQSSIRLNLRRIAVSILFNSCLTCRTLQ